MYKCGVIALTIMHHSPHTGVTLTESQVIGWAVLVGFSRIYLGVHYPGDVLFGMMLGTILAFVIWLFGKRYLPINE